MKRAAPLGFPELTTAAADPAELRAAERKALGFCLTGHPCADARDDARAYGAVPLASAGRLLNSRDARITVAACCTRVLERPTRAGDWMAILWLEDDRARREAVCFPRAWSAVADLVEDAARPAAQDVLLLDVRDDGDGKLIVEGVNPLYPTPPLVDSGPSLGDFIVVDVETTLPPGARDKLDPATLRVVEIGVALFKPAPSRTRGGASTHVLSQRLSRFVDPGCPIDEESRSIHGITDDDVKGQPTFAQRAVDLAVALGGPRLTLGVVPPRPLNHVQPLVYAPRVDAPSSRVLVTYNGRRFDLPLLAAEFSRAGIQPDFLPPGIVDPARSIDVYDHVRTRYQGRKDRPASKRLAAQCDFFRVPLAKAHRAADDAAATGGLLVELRAAGYAPRNLDRLFSPRS